MRLPTTTEMVRRLERLAESGDLTDQERAALQPMQIAMHSGVVTQLTGEQVEELDAMYSQHFRKR
ncbi:hypothetical protein [Pandoraea apista]|uniref:Uncharacterized protein n=1 Tax=Pandoraea apista TaxID=93218 RepID=A0ABX9ZHJ5_9BURK|nr:hypothetical protein [Pandoraea apista]PTE02679.1 hypothetical protein C7830_00175 [Pandoraea apista]RRJ27549.1 hypothetical protein EIB05_21555 [Pandoraea apista]RRJ73160.1 hypothetical protein EIL82_22010 [Pandoraea apista]RSD06471.1 hypothetical protein EJB12_21600 [Pandoraea apista]RSD11286.1 hypothetical protein EIZ52_21545 [Pandoraea apista]